MNQVATEAVQLTIDTAVEQAVAEMKARRVQLRANACRYCGRDRRDCDCRFHVIGNFKPPKGQRRRRRGRH